MKLTLIFLILLSFIGVFGVSGSSCDDICTKCILSTSNLMSSYECGYRNFSLDDCVRYINNELGPFICGTIYQDGIMNYIDQQCMNEMSPHMLARNLGVGICHSFCKSRK